MFQDFAISYVSSSKIICVQFFILLLSVLIFYVFVTLPSVSPLKRSRTQRSGSACSRNS